MESKSENKADATKKMEAVCSHPAHQIRRFCDTGRAYCDSCGEFIPELDWKDVKKDQKSF